MSDSVIEKRCKQFINTAGCVSDTTQDYEDLIGFAVDLAHFVMKHPAHTAREKARKVAEANLCEPGTVLWWDEHVRVWLNDVQVFIYPEDESELKALTPTPAEIATGCCCWVVPEKGE